MRDMFIAIVSIVTGIPIVLLIAGIISPVKTFGAVGWILDTVMGFVCGASIGVLTAKKIIRR